MRKRVIVFASANSISFGTIYTHWKHIYISIVLNDSGFGCIRVEIASISAFRLLHRGRSTVNGSAKTLEIPHKSGASGMPIWRAECLYDNYSLLVPLL